MLATSVTSAKLQPKTIPRRISLRWEAEILLKYQAKAGINGIMQDLGPYMVCYNLGVYTVLTLAVPGQVREMVLIYEDKYLHGIAHHGLARDRFFYSACR